MPLSDTVKKVLGKSKQKRKAPGPISAERLINRYYADWNKADKKKRTRGVFHPSALTYCRRYQQFEILNAPQQSTGFPPQVLRIFDNGHNREVGLAKALREGAAKLGGRFVPKVIVSDPSILLEGEVDGILYMPDGDGGEIAYVVDFKTINHRKFTELVRVSQNYSWQFTAYMHATGIPQTICYYENKDKQTAREFFLRFRKKRWARIKRTVIDYVLDATRNEELVPMDEEKCTKRQCPFYDLCMSEPEFDEVDERTKKQRLRLIAA